MNSINHLENLVEERRDDAQYYWGMSGYYTRIGDTENSQYYKDLGKYYWSVMLLHQKKLDKAIKRQAKIDAKKKSQIEKYEGDIVTVLSELFSDELGWSRLPNRDAEAKTSFSWGGKPVKKKEFWDVLAILDPEKIDVPGDRILPVATFVTMTEDEEGEIEFENRWFALGRSSNNLSFSLSEIEDRLLEMETIGENFYKVFEIQEMNSFILTVWG